ncbi:hypothetical protein HWV62_29356 [Athelia sp. TMB]|nr:hypothetical protein HWV62_29356 [Athelia sp. TMB]
MKRAVVTHDGRILVYASDSKQALREDFVKYTVQPVEGDEDEDDDDEEEESDEDEEDEVEIVRANKGKQKAVSVELPIRPQPSKPSKRAPQQAPRNTAKPQPLPVKSLKVPPKPNVPNSRSDTRRYSFELSDDSATLENLERYEPYVPKPTKPWSPLILPDMPPVKPPKKRNRLVARSPPAPPELTPADHFKPRSRAPSYGHSDLPHHRRNQEPLRRAPAHNLQAHTSPVAGPSRQPHIRAVQPPSIPDGMYGYYHGYGQYLPDPRIMRDPSPYLAPTGAQYPSNNISPHLPEHHYPPQFYQGPPRHHYPPHDRQ